MSLVLDGDKAMVRHLLSLPRKVQRRVLRPAVTKGSRVISSAAKKQIPTRTQSRKAGTIRTGQLRKSIGQKVKTYGNTVVGVIGPRSGFAIEADGRIHDPVKIAHLVEYGHGGPASAPAHPFMRPAFQQSKWAAGIKLQQEVRLRLQKEATAPRK